MGHLAKGAAVLVPTISGAREDARAFFRADPAAVAVDVVATPPGRATAYRYRLHADRVDGELVAVMPEVIGPAPCEWCGESVQVFDGIGGACRTGGRCSLGAS